MRDLTATHLKGYNMDINDLKNAVKPDGGLRANGRIPKTQSQKSSKNKPLPIGMAMF